MSAPTHRAYTVIKREGMISADEIERVLRQVQVA